MAITVLPTNFVATAFDDIVATSQNTPLDINILANDNDPKATLTIDNGPAGGQATIEGPAGNQFIHYTPTFNAHGPDSFTYHFTTADGLVSNTATVFIDVLFVNSIPVGDSDTFATSEDIRLTSVVTGSDADNDPLQFFLVSNTSHGILSLRSDGVFTYTPGRNWYGTDSFVFTVSDGKGGISSDAIATIDIASVDDSPTITDDIYSVIQDTQLVVNNTDGVLANDSSIEFTSLTASVNTYSGGGVLNLDTNGSFTYNPVVDFVGIDTFTYSLLDNNANPIGIGTVTIIVNPTGDTNTAPTANSEYYNVREEYTLDVIPQGVLTNDIDPNGDTLTAYLTSLPSMGVVTFNPDGSFIYVQNSNFVGTDSFTYKAGDGNGGFSQPATVTINIVAVNAPPIARDDIFATDANASVTLSVLGNDNDPEGLALTVSSYSTPLHGALTPSGTPGAFSYTPDAGWSGVDSFTYRANDGSLDSNLATATIVVRAMDMNQPPIANGDNYPVNNDQTLTMTWSELMSNDSDPNGDTLQAMLATHPAQGSLAPTLDGITYTPRANYHGPDSFTYMISDSRGGFNTATVSIAVNDPPVANDNSYTIDISQTLDVGAPGVLANDTDGDNDTLQVFPVTSSTLNGNYVIYADGSFQYTPQLNYHGIDSFTYTISDGQGGFSTATVNIIVDTPPLANSDFTYSTNEDTSLNVDVLSNDISRNGDPLTAVLVDNVTTDEGNVVLTPVGIFIYTPAADFNGTATFTYKANDGYLDSDIATVTITVHPVNDAPSFTKGADQIVTDGHGAQTVPRWATGISAGPPDESAQTLSFTVTNDNTALFSVQPVIDASGQLTYTLASSNGYGMATVSVTLNDDGGTDYGGVDTSAVQSFTVRVPLAANNDSYIVSEDNTLVIASTATGCRPSKR